MIRVAIADDHHLFSGGLADALEAVPDLQVVGIAGTAGEAIEMINGTSIDVLLLDWEMPGGGGQVVLDHPKCPSAIIVTMHTDAASEATTDHRKTAGVVSKSLQLGQLAAAIRAVGTGATLPSEPDQLAVLLAEHRSPKLDPGAQSLTDREVELLQLLASGVSSTEDLADRLYISQKTVKNHLASIFQKLSVSDRTQAAIEAIRLGFTRKDHDR